ncbi:MAG: ABC transporter substrate-binding protein [Hahellaceae bacterium]|nr:ABC transporter substrate-binding protein [Hahellaceae bacterium]
MQLSRRDLLGLSLKLAATASAPCWLNACAKQEPAVRVATNVWPGYEFLHAAEATGQFREAPVSMLAMPSATACLQALASGNAEAAALTLDELLTARVDNMPLTVVTVLDLSVGGDVVLARPGITTPADLKGQRIGVEQSAVGAVMLHALLAEAQLSQSDVTIVYATVDEHVARFRAGDVDALVTFQPVPSQLREDEAHLIYDSSRIPGQIMDVLAVRPEVLARSPNALKTLVKGHFTLLEQWKKQPGALSTLLAGRLGVAPESVSAAYEGLELPDAIKNRYWLSGTPTPLDQAAEALMQTMLGAGLLPKSTSLAQLSDHRFLP